MAIHMFRLFIEPPKGDAESAVNNWVENHTEWGDDPVEHTLREVAESGDEDTAYISLDYRFVQEKTASDLLDDLESRLQSIQGGLWYRVGYHECCHDDENDRSCTWENTREGGDVPANIPQFEHP